MTPRECKTTVPVPGNQPSTLDSARISRARVAATTLPPGSLHRVSTDRHRIDQIFCLQLPAHGEPPPRSE